MLSEDFHQLGIEIRELCDNYSLKASMVALTNGYFATAFFYCDRDQEKMKTFVMNNLSESFKLIQAELDAEKARN